MVVIMSCQASSGTMADYCALVSVSGADSDRLTRALTELGVRWGLVPDESNPTSIVFRGSAETVELLVSPRFGPHGLLVAHFPTVEAMSDERQAELEETLGRLATGRGQVRSCDSVEDFELPSVYM